MTPDRPAQAVYGAYVRCGLYGAELAEGDRLKPLPGWVDEHLPPRGPCAFCGGPDARHRLVDAIRGRFKAGESVAFLAKDYDLPEDFVRRLVGL